MYKVILVLSILFFLSGCSHSIQSASSKNNVGKDDPPLVQVKLDESVYTLLQGSFCWGDSRTASCVDYGTPFEITEYVEPIKVSRGEKITLSMKRKPLEHSLTFINLTTKETVEIDLKNNQFKAPTERGLYIINFYGLWEKDESNTSGDSSYVLKIVVK
ncbi:MAG TPA: hypothetical protein VNS08_12445 [Ureibacillus sp.]|nr:hypothetical protein [Ureibacillus sp.]